MDNLLQVILLGIIEGITEFLPISSTGHLLIAQHWLGPRSELFTVAIQAGAILAVVAIYWRRLWDLTVHLSQAANRSYLFKLLTAFVITVIGGFAAKEMGLELPETVAPVAWAMVIGGARDFSDRGLDGAQADQRRAHLAGRELGRHRADPRRGFSRHVALRRHAVRGDAGGHDVAARGRGVLVPARDPDDVCGHRVRAAEPLSRTTGSDRRTGPTSA